MKSEKGMEGKPFACFARFCSGQGWGAEILRFEQKDAKVTKNEARRQRVGVNANVLRLMTVVDVNI